MRYIAFPKSSLRITAFDLPSTRFTPKARADRISQIFEDREKNMTPPLTGPSLEYLNKEVGGSVVATPHDATPMTGVTILDAPVGSKPKLQEMMLDHTIVEDEPLELIHPITSDISFSKGADADLWHLEAIRLLRARGSGFDGKGEGVGVAVLDTGIKKVKELKGRVKSAWRMSDNNKPKKITSIDTHGHGTQVAGLIAGKNVGVAPASDLMNFIMLPEGKNSNGISDFTLAMEFVAMQPNICVMSMSAGKQGYHEGMKAAMQMILNAGILPVIAIGNYHPDQSFSPGNYTEALSVGASDKMNGVWRPSSSGTMAQDSQLYDIPDIVAPGVNVTSCTKDGDFRADSGTSLATPIVSGVAALIIEKHPSITEPDLRAHILETAEKLPGVPDIRQGEGLAQVPTDLWFAGS